LEDVVEETMGAFFGEDLKFSYRKMIFLKSRLNLSVFSFVSLRLSFFFFGLYYFPSFFFLPFLLLLLVEELAGKLLFFSNSVNLFLSFCFRHFCRK